MAAKSRTRTVVRRVYSRGRRVARRIGASPQAQKAKQRTRTLAIGGAAAFAFGVLQDKVELPSIKGVPDSLTYGAGALTLGLLSGSNILTDIGTGPFMAGLHNLGLHGFSETVGYDDSGDGNESVEGEFDDVVAGDFDDI